MLEYWWDAIYTRRNTLILMPAGAAKTTWGNTIAGSHIISLHPDIRVGLFSQTDTFANDFSAAIMNTFESNDMHHALFGDISHGDKWTNGAWRRQGIGRWLLQSKDMSLFAGGTGGQVASKRFDLLLGDDVLGKENTETQEQRDKVDYWYNAVLSPRVVASGVQIFFGTRWAEGDLYQKMMTPVEEGGYGFRTHVIRALHGADFCPCHEGQEPFSYWPKLWPVEKLLELRLKNPAQFDCTYQNDISGIVTGDIWTKDIIHYYGTRNGKPEEELPRPGEYIKRMGADLAMSMKERADFTARVHTAERMGVGEFYVLGAHQTKTTAGHDEYLHEGYNAFPGTGLVVVEKAVIGLTVIQNMMTKYPTMPVKGSDADTDKRTRQEACSSKARERKLFFHESLRDSQLIRDMLGFPHPGVHDDLPDALYYSMNMSGSTFWYTAIPIGR